MVNTDKGLANKIDEGLYGRLKDWYGWYAWSKFTIFFQGGGKMLMPYYKTWKIWAEEVCSSCDACDALWGNLGEKYTYQYQRDDKKSMFGSHRSPLSMLASPLISFTGLIFLT